MENKLYHLLFACAIVQVGLLAVLLGLVEHDGHIGVLSFLFGVAFITVVYLGYTIYSMRITGTYHTVNEFYLYIFTLVAISIGFFYGVLYGFYESITPTTKYTNDILGTTIVILSAFIHLAIAGYLIFFLHLQLAKQHSTTQNYNTIQHRVTTGFA